MASTGWVLRGGKQADGTTAPLELPDSLVAGADRSASLLDQLRALFGTQEVGPRLFVECILHDRPVEPSFREGWKAQQVIDAALESHRTGRRVPHDPKVMRA